MTFCWPSGLGEGFRPANRQENSIAFLAPSSPWDVYELSYSFPVTPSNRRLQDRLKVVGRYLVRQVIQGRFCLYFLLVQKRQHLEQRSPSPYLNSPSPPVLGNRATTDPTLLKERLQHDDLPF